MTAAAAPVVRTVAFGDLAAGVWGAAWGAAEPFVALGAQGSARALAEATIDGATDAGDWRLTADGAELVLSAQTEAVPASFAKGGEPVGFDQLCRVRGRLRLDGGEHEVDCLGRRGCRTQEHVLQFESLRDVSAWFEPDDGLALLSLRPPKAAGHAADVVTAAVFDPRGAVAVADPRMSTTYAGDELPTRVGLELWLTGEDSEQYPRRAAGEATGARVAASIDAFAISAALLRVHSRGNEGAGVYILARRR